MFIYICYFHKINRYLGETLAVRNFNLRERILNTKFLQIRNTEFIMVSRSGIFKQDS